MAWPVTHSYADSKVPPSMILEKLQRREFTVRIFHQQVFAMMEGIRIERRYRKPVNMWFAHRFRKAWHSMPLDGEHWRLNTAIALLKLESVLAYSGIGCPAVVDPVVFEGIIAGGRILWPADAQEIADMCVDLLSPEGSLAGEFRVDLDAIAPWQSFAVFREIAARCGRPTACVWAPRELSDHADAAGPWSSWESEDGLRGDGADVVTEAGA